MSIDRFVEKHLESFAEQHNYSYNYGAKLLIEERAITYILSHRESLIWQGDMYKFYDEQKHHYKLKKLMDGEKKDDD